MRRWTDISNFWTFLGLILATVIGVLLAIALYLTVFDRGVTEEAILEHLITIEDQTRFLVCVQGIPFEERTSDAITACRFPAPTEKG